METVMDEEYLIGRARASLEMARRAANSTARLIHFDLAGRYSLAAARYACDLQLRRDALP